jgi:predicted negative regulator of RcsB-dependent stress response
MAQHRLRSLGLFARSAAGAGFMATHLDLQEQEQLDEIKAFWKQYGNLITWTITLVLAGFAAMNGWNWWQREQGAKAGAMYDEFEQATLAGDADKAARIFGDMKDRFGRTAFTAQAGLLVARVQSDKSLPDAAEASLTWVAEHASDEGLQSLAHLRLAQLLADKKAYDDALKQLDQVKTKEFLALADDRRGDVLAAKGQTAEAVAAWKKSWDALPDSVDLRRMVEAKLIARAAAPEPATAASGVAP